MIEAIDRFGINMFMGSDSAFLDAFALNVTNAWMWVPMYLALLFLVIRNHDNMQQILICFSCGVLGVLLATGLTTVVTKPLLERLRPCNDPEFKYLVDIAGNLRNKDFSFFSSHAATSMSLVVFFSLMVRSRLLTISLLAWSLTTCWTRLYLGQHFFTDVMVGLCWGAIVGSLCYFVYKAVSTRVHTPLRVISTKFTKTGFDFRDVDVLVTTVVLSFTYAVIAF